VQNGGKLDLKLSATPAPTSLCLHLFSLGGGMFGTFAKTAGNEISA